MWNTHTKPDHTSPDNIYDSDSDVRTLINFAEISFSRHKKHRSNSLSASEVEERDQFESLLLIIAPKFVLWRFWLVLMFLTVPPLLLTLAAHEMGDSRTPFS